MQKSSGKAKPETVSKEQSRFLQNEQWMNVQADMVQDWQAAQVAAGQPMRCPVCHTALAGHGVTCGSANCIKMWLHPTGPILPGRIIVESVVRPADAENLVTSKSPKVTAVNEALVPFTGNFQADRMFALFAVDDVLYTSEQAVGHLRAFYCRYRLAVPPNDHAILVTAHQQRIRLAQSEEGYKEAAGRSEAWLSKQQTTTKRKVTKF